LILLSKNNQKNSETRGEEERKNKQFQVPPHINSYLIVGLSFVSLQTILTLNQSLPQMHKIIIIMLTIFFIKSSSS
jgi:hypothetical protein